MDHRGRCRGRVCNHEGTDRHPTSISSSILSAVAVVGWDFDSSTLSHASSWGYWGGMIVSMFDFTGKVVSHISVPPLLNLSRAASMTNALRQTSLPGPQWVPGGGPCPTGAVLSHSKLPKPQKATSPSQRHLFCTTPFISNPPHRVATRRTIPATDRVENPNPHRRQGFD